MGKHKQWVFCTSAVESNLKTNIDLYLFISKMGWKCWLNMKLTKFSLLKFLKIYPV